MIDGSEKRNGWLNFERQSPHVFERRSNAFQLYTLQTRTIQIFSKISLTIYKIFSVTRGRFSWYYICTQGPKGTFTQKGQGARH